MTDAIKKLLDECRKMVTDQNQDTGPFTLSILAATIAMVCGINGYDVGAVFDKMKRMVVSGQIEAVNLGRGGKPS